MPQKPRGPGLGLVNRERRKKEVLKEATKEETKDVSPNLRSVSETGVGTSVPDQDQTREIRDERRAEAETKRKSRTDLLHVKRTWARKL